MQHLENCRRSLQLHSFERCNSDTADVLSVDLYAFGNISQIIASHAGTDTRYTVISNQTIHLCKNEDHYDH